MTGGGTAFVGHRGGPRGAIARRLPAVILALGWLAPAIMLAATESAPLEGAKQELKELRRDQATSNAVKSGGKLDLGPEIQSPVTEALPLESMNRQKKQDQELERKKQMRRQGNWLVDGVNDLKNDRPKDRFAAAGNKASGAGEEGAPDPTDPNYMLKVYTEQKKDADDKTAANKPPTGAAPDPIAPFLQNWLGNSPAQGKFFNEFSRGGDAATVVGGTDGMPAVSTTRSYAPAEAGSPVRGPAIDRGSQPNPYLQALDEPAAKALAGPIAEPAGGLDFLAKPADVPAAGRMVDPLPAERVGDRKAPLAMPADDKKYFPQLKRF